MAMESRSIKEPPSQANLTAPAADMEFNQDSIRSVDTTAVKVQEIITEEIITEEIITEEDNENVQEMVNE